MASESLGPYACGTQMFGSDSSDDMIVKYTDSGVDGAHFVVLESGCVRVRVCGWHSLCCVACTVDEFCNECTLWLAEEVCTRTFESIDSLMLAFGPDMTGDWELSGLCLCPNCVCFEMCGYD